MSAAAYVIAVADTATASGCSMKRWTPSTRCPICGGCDRDPRGEERRCAGYLSTDETHAYCTRGEHAGSLRPDDGCSPPAYPHRLRGPCGCGTTHGADLRPREEPARYVYKDEHGADLFRVCIRGHGAGKLVWQEHPNGGGWEKGLNGARRVLYRLPDLLACDGRVYVVEGERDVETLRKRGLTATTSSGGAGQWRHTDSSPLRGREIVVIADADEPGRRHARDVVSSVGGRAVECARGKDITDHLASGGTMEELVPMREEPKPKPQIGPDPDEADAAEPEPEDEATEDVRKRIRVSPRPTTSKDAPRTTVETSDIRNAERLVEIHGADLRSVGEWGKWMSWTGHGWRIDHRSAAAHLAKETARIIAREAEEEAK